MTFFSLTFRTQALAEYNPQLHVKYKENSVKEKKKKKKNSNQLFESSKYRRLPRISPDPMGAQGQAASNRNNARMGDLPST